MYDVFMTSAKVPILSPAMLTSLGLIGMLGPFGTDVYLPALPAMAQNLRVSSAHIELTLSAFTLGMAIGQFFLGALSDRFGRRVVLLLGGTLMTIAAAVGAAAPTAEMLIALCFFMGVFGSAGTVNGRAVVADLSHGNAATRPFAILGLTISVAPIIGPLGGTALMALGGWRAIFVGLAIFAAIATLSIAIFVPESLAYSARHRGGLKTTLVNSKRILTNRAYLTYAVVIWFGFGTMFAYISSSSFIVQNNLHLPASGYALIFGVNGCGVILSSFITALIAKRTHPRRILLTGVVCQIVVILALVTIVLTHTVAIWTVWPTLFLLATSIGFILGPATALAMAEVRFASGTALALMGSVQFIFAGIAATLIGFLSSDALVSLTMVAGGMVLCVVLAVIIGTVSGRRAIRATTR